MITGQSTLSIKKKDLLSQKTPTIGFSKTQFAHKATLGATGINLTSLTVPTEMTSNGFSNPSTGQLLAANLLTYKNNLTLVSSARGLLQQGLSYVVSSSSQITFVGFTALEGEIFSGTIDYNAVTNSMVIDATPVVATGDLAANTTDFNVGTPYKVGQFITAQIGAMIVYLDGQQMFRNTGNSSVVLDGDYYEVDAGSGLGSIVRFNTTSPSIRSVCAVSNGLLYEKPSGSTQAVLESIQGQVNNMGSYVASATGNSLTTILGGAPTNQDLQAFGNRVLAVEQNRARIDQSNAWTANQQLLGKVDGVAVAAGYIGQAIEPVSPNSVVTLATSGDWFNLSSFTLTPGVWMLQGNAEFTASNDTGRVVVAAISSGSGNITTDHVTNKNTARGHASETVTGRITTLTIPSHIVNVSTNTVYYIKGTINVSTNSPTARANFSAIRIA